MGGTYHVSFYLPDRCPAAMSHRIVLTGPNMDALTAFMAELRQTFEFEDGPQVLKSEELLTKEQELEEVRNFLLVMPRMSRTMIYVEGDRSSMYEELQLMCGGIPSHWHPERGKEFWFHSKRNICSI